MTGLPLEAPYERTATARRWLREFEDKTIVMQRVRNLPRVEAEHAAYRTLLIEFLNANHPDTDPSRCAHCGACGATGRVLLPIGVGPHAWLHLGCWEPWRARRRAEAIDQLGEMGIEAQ